MALEILEEGIAAGARASELAKLMGVGLSTLQRWRRQFAGDGEGVDGRKGSSRHVAHRLSEEERQRILLTCNEPQYASLPPGQIVPDLADQGIYIGSERSFYRVLHALASCTAAVGHGYRRSQGRCLGLGLQVQTRYGVGTFLISPPALKGSGCISTW